MNSKTIVGILVLAFSVFTFPTMAQAPLPKLETTLVQPVRVEKHGTIFFADFGADAFGNLQITLPQGTPASNLTVRLGEKLDTNGVIDRHPPGSVNYREVKLTTQPGKSIYQLSIPSRSRHSDPNAVHTLPEVGEITVFRYAEIEGTFETLDANSLRQIWVHNCV